MNPQEGWASSKAAQRLRLQSDMVPGRGEMLALIAALTASRAGARPRVMDVGCGHGDVTAEILKAAPGASVTMIDYSEEMLRRAAERFAGDPRVSLVKQDLTRGLPTGLAEEPFDVVASCFTFHNIDPSHRVALYGEIRAALRPGGLLLNADRFRGESSAMADWEFDAWIDWMTTRARERYGIQRTPAEIRRRQLELDASLGDQPGSLWAMRDDLTRAGFAHVDCLYKNQISALVVALKGG